MNIHIRGIDFGSTRKAGFPFLDPKQQFSPFPELPVAPVLKFCIYASTVSIVKSLTLPNCTISLRNVVRFPRHMRTRCPCGTEILGDCATEHPWKGGNDFGTCVAEYEDVCADEFLRCQFFSRFPIFF